MMIVEDEPIERQGIHLMLANSFSTLLTICEAEDGFEAVRVCKEFKPHIVMIDIHMPGMNGLEAIVALRQIDSAIRFVILTSHDKFEYAHEAIKLGVEDYILKPAGIARLRESIGSVVHKLEHDIAESSEKTALLKRMESIRPILERDCVYTLMAEHGSPFTAEDFRFLDFEVNGGFCFTVVCEGRMQDWLPGVKEALVRVGVRCIGEEVNQRLVFFALFHTPPKRDYARQLVDYALQQADQARACPALHAGLSGVANTQVEMGALYAQAEQALRAAIDRNVPVAVFGGDGGAQPQAMEPWQALLALQHAMTARDTFQQKVADIGRQAMDGRALPDAVRWCVSVAEQFAAWLQENTGVRPEEDTAAVAAIRQANSGAALITAFQAALQELTQGVWQEGDAYSNTLIGRILAYIEANFRKNLSLDSIAEQFSITPFYLSRLIKKKIGRSFPDLLADYRIRCAKQLLTQGKSAKEVTYEVGFSSQNYFGKTFKKWTGVTPTEYKEKHC